MPEQDAVLAITSGVKDMQAVLNLAWNKLLPGLKDALLPPDPAMRDDLAKTLKGLTMKTPQGAAEPAASVKPFDRSFKFEPNAQASLDPCCLEGGGDGPLTLVLRSDGRESRIPCGRGEWTKTLAAAWRPPRATRRRLRRLDRRRRTDRPDRPRRVPVPRHLPHQVRGRQGHARPRGQRRLRPLPRGAADGPGGMSVERPQALDEWEFAFDVTAPEPIPFEAHPRPHGRDHPLGRVE